MKIVKSPIPTKKYRAIFDDGTHTDFGATGYEDFTTHKDETRKKLYLSRHRKTEDWNNYRSPGSLSRWILWNLPSLSASIQDYKKRFRL